MNFKRPAASMRATPGRSASRAFLPSAPTQALRRATTFTAAGSRPLRFAPSASRARKALTSSTLPQPSMIAPSATPPVMRWPSGPLLAT